MEWIELGPMLRVDGRLSINCRLVDGLVSFTT